MIKILVMAFLSVMMLICFAQKPDKKVVKARRTVSEAKHDLVVADEILMIAQVDSIVQSEKKKNILEEKNKSQQNKIITKQPSK